MHSKLFMTLTIYLKVKDNDILTYLFLPTFNLLLQSSLDHLF